MLGLEPESRLRHCGPSSSRPTHARCGRIDEQHLTCSRRTNHVRRTMPLGCQNKQRLLVRAAEHAGEAPAVHGNCLEYLTAFAHANTTFVRNVGVPDGPFRIDTDTVWYAIAKIGPHTPIRQTS